MGKNTIALEQNGVVVRGLELRHPDVVQYFSTIDQDELEVAFVRAVEVGTFCLQRASTCNDFDFVRRQVDALLGAVEKTVLTMPSQVRNRTSCPNRNRRWSSACTNPNTRQQLRKG